MQTTLIPAGGAAIVEFHTEVPGSYVLVDHSIFRAFNKGALAILKVDGPREQDGLFGQGSRFGLSRRQARASKLVSQVDGMRQQHGGTLTLESRSRRARRFSPGTCSVCHQAERRRASQGVFPPLAGSDFLAADPKRPIEHRC